MTSVSPPSTHLTAESTVAMRIKCLGQGYNTLTQQGFEHLTAVSIKRHITHMSNVFQAKKTNISATTDLQRHIDALFINESTKLLSHEKTYI